MARIINQRARVVGGDGAVEIPRHSIAGEAVRLGVDPVVWAQVNNIGRKPTKATTWTPLMDTARGRCGGATSKPLKKRVNS